MAMNAVGHVFVRGRGKQRVDEILMAIDTGALGNTSVSWFDLNRIGVVLKRKGDRMKEAVVRLGDPFADRVMGEMTIVAHRNVVMT